MKKGVIILAILILFLSVSGCKTLPEKHTENVSNTLEIKADDTDSFEPSKITEPKSDSTPYTYECCVRLREDMPEYRFLASGLKTSDYEWSVGFVTGLEVYDENGLPILSVDVTSLYEDNEQPGHPVYNQMMDTMSLHVVDVNFDGYKDVIIMNSFCGAPSNSWYDCWLWDAKASTFIYSESFATICNPAIDRDKQCIYSNGGSGANVHVYDIYRFINSEFVVSNRLDWAWSGFEESPDHDSLTATGIQFKEEKLVNGQMKIIRDEFLPNEEGEAVLEHYNKEEPWQLDNFRWGVRGHDADEWLK